MEIHEYLYPPLIEITKMPKINVIKTVCVNTVKQRFERCEMTKAVFDEILVNINKGRMEVSLALVEASADEPIEEPIEEPFEAPIEKIIKK